MDKVLKVVRPANLPVVWPKNLELVIKLTTAKPIGLTLPQSLL
jgi:hypothetical protein